MLRIASHLRHALGMAVAGCVAATGLTLIVPAAAHAIPLQSQTITFDNPADTLLTVGSVTLDATASSGLPVSYTSSTTDVCTVAGSEVTLVGQGQCTVVAHQAGGTADDIYYDAAPDVTRQFLVRLPQTITPPVVGDQLLSTGSVTITATATSGSYVGFYTPNAEVCSVPVYGRRPTSSTRPASVVRPQSPPIGTTVTLHKLGTCTITLTQPGNSQWLAAPEVTVSFQVVAAFTKPALTLQVPAGVALSKRKAGFTVTSPSAKPAVTVTSATASVCKVASTSTVRLVKAGTCTLTAAQAGVASVSTSFPVWRAPAIPARAKTTQTVPVLGRGESGLRVRVKPAKVCSVAGGTVTLIAPGTCRVRVVDHGTQVRSGSIRVAFVKSAKPSKQLRHAGRVLFAFDSAVLTPAARKTLRGDLATLRKARTVIVYGNTFGPGHNSARSRRLAADRAAAVVGFLKAHGVEAKAVTVAAAMANPVSKDPAKNRRADIYYRR